MQKLIHYQNNLILIIFIVSQIFFLSCGEEHALKKETVYFSSENIDWLVEVNSGDFFFMTDDNNISQSFSFKYQDHYFLKSWGGFLCITTYSLDKEYHYQAFSSGFGNSFTISLSAEKSPFGDILYISLNDYGIAYDLSHQIITRTDYPFGNRSLTMTDKGYEEFDTILSHVEFHPQFQVGDSIFRDVLHFVFNDFEDQQTIYSIKEIFISKKIGLIKFTYHNGLSVMRE